MVRSRKSLGICLVLGVLCTASCTKDIKNVETEYFSENRGDDSVVLGRIGVVEEGVEKSWESPRVDPFIESSFQIFIRGRHSELKLSHYIRGDGYFCLGLPPGEYRLWRWVYRFPRGQAKTVEPLSIYFDVLPGKYTYIGTLYIHLSSVGSLPPRAPGANGTKPRYEIVNEYGKAMAFSKNHYPDFPHSVQRHLMHFSR
jgi:hypothetical protein